MTLDEIQIELAGVCNAACSYCTWQKRTAGKQLMATELALRLLDEARTMGVTTIRYHGLGESLLHPQLLDVIARGEALGFDHSLSTNAYVLEGELASTLSGFSRLSMILAMHAVMPPKFRERCTSNAEDYLVRANRNRQVQVQMVCAEGASGHWRTFVDRFLPLVERTENASIFLKQPLTWPKNGPVRGFIPELPSHGRVQIDTTPTPRSLARGCRMPERFLMILADGTCAPCCVGADDWGLPSAVDAGLGRCGIRHA